MDMQNNYTSSENQYNTEKSSSTEYSGSNNTDYNSSSSCNSYNPIYPSGTWRPESSYHYSYQTNNNIPNNKKPKKVKTKKLKSAIIL